jgi:hypothetical protein
MPDQRGVDRVASLVEGHAEACLAGLKEAGNVPRPSAAVADGAGWVVLTMAFPAPPELTVPPGLPECDADCLALLVLKRGQNRLSARRIRGELERLRMGVYGIATVKRPQAPPRRRAGRPGQAIRRPTRPETCESGRTPRRAGAPGPETFPRPRAISAFHSFAPQPAGSTP